MALCGKSEGRTAPIGCQKHLQGYRFFQAGCPARQRWTELEGHSSGWNGRRGENRFAILAANILVISIQFVQE